MTLTIAALRFLLGRQVGAASCCFVLLRQRTALESKLRRVRRVYWRMRNAFGVDSSELTRREAYLIRDAIRGIGTSAHVVRVTVFAKARSGP